jgi:hypothetical protein
MSSVQFRASHYRSDLERVTSYEFFCHPMRRSSSLRREIPYRRSGLARRLEEVFIVFPYAVKFVLCTVSVWDVTASSERSPASLKLYESESRKINDFWTNIL